MAARPKDRRSDQIAQDVANSLQDKSATVVGAGAVGRQIAIQLVALGISQLRVFDPGIVEARNLLLGGFRADDVGRPKVDAVGDLCHQTNPLLDFTGIQARFSTRQAVDTAVFCCVDTFAERRRVWRAVETRCPFWADVHVVGELARVFIAHDEPSRRRYGATLEKLSETHAVKNAHAPVLISTSAVAASLAVYQFVRYVDGLPLYQDVSFDLAAGQLHIADTKHA